MRLSVLLILSYPSALSVYTIYDEFFRFYKSNFMRLLNNGRKRVEISIGYHRRNSIVGEKREREKAYLNSV